MKPLITSEDFPIGACVLVEREGKRIWLKTGVRKPCIVSDPHGLWQYNAWSYEVTKGGEAPHPKCDEACFYHCTQAGKHPPECDAGLVAYLAAHPEDRQFLSDMAKNAMI